MMEQEELRLSVISGEDHFNIAVGYRMPTAQSVTAMRAESLAAVDCMGMRFR